MKLCRSMALIGVLSLVGSFVDADDWPQWRGPERTDVSGETGLLQQWPEGGPPLAWMNQQAGLGYAGFSVVGDRLFTMGEEEDEQFVLCLNSSNGEQIWRTSIDSGYANDWGGGPRSTPTIDGDRVYFLSSNGVVGCLDARDGSALWSKSFAEFGGKKPSWGFCESVLVDGDRVVCTPGGAEGAMLALDKNTGQVLWQSKEFTDPAQYPSIIVGNINGKRQYVQLTMKSLVGINPDDGALLWKSDWPGRIAVIPTPIFSNGKVYVCSGYGTGSKLVSFGADSQPTDDWFNKVMKNHHGGVILLDGHLYGYSDQVGWVCQDFETGEKVWAEERELGKGAIAYADGRFYCLDEKSGDVVLIEASAEGWNEQGRFTLQPLSERRSRQGGIWVHPVIAHGKLYLRDQEIIYCFDVGQRQQP